MKQSLGLLLLMASPVLADVTGGISSANSWLISTLGPLLIVLGLVVAGMCIVFGNREAAGKGVYVLIGGAIITSASEIKDLIVGFF